MRVQVWQRAQRVAIGLLALWLLFLPVGEIPIARANITPSAATANGWSFVEVARVDQNGFASLEAGRVAADGAVVVYGEHNNQTGLFHVDGAVVTKVATSGTVLPGDLGVLSDIGAFASRFAVLPNGDVIFPARVTEGTLSPAFMYTFRWRNDAITLMQPSTETDPDTFTQLFDHDPHQATGDNRWLTLLRSGTSPNQTFNYALTNGTPPAQPLFSFTNSGANCVFNSAPLVAANANGVAAYYEVQQTSVAAGANCQDPTQRVWSIKLAGAATGTIGGGSSFEESNTHTGNDLMITNLLLLNNQNQVAAVREIYNSPATFVARRQLVRFGNGSESILQDTEGPVAVITPADLDDSGRVLYTATLDDFLTKVLMDGPDLTDDRILGMGDTLFGKPVIDLSLVERPAAVGAAITDGFAFRYRLDDGTVGIALARKVRPRWANPAGGGWSTAANWLPAVTPGEADTVVFDLPATYPVNMGTRRVAGVLVQKGNVTLRNGALEVTDNGSISVGGATANDIPRLTIGQPGAAISDTAIVANIGVGMNAAGELRIDNASIRAPESEENPGFGWIGFAAPATATVTGGANWGWQTLNIGGVGGAHLRVENGALVGPVSEKLWIGGNVLALPLRNDTGAVHVDGSSNLAGPHGLGTLLGPVVELTVGEALIGRLDITNGGRVIAITTTVGTRDHGNRTDAFLTVDGTNATRPATFESGSDEDGGLFVATGAGTDAQVSVLSGGVMTVSQLSLAHAAQSNVFMSVDGLETADAGERRSAVFAPKPASAAQAGAARVAAAPEIGTCVIGHAGFASLNVSNGGLVHCRQIAVGMLPGSRGELNIAGTFRSVNAHVIAGGGFVEDGAVCIGRVPLCGATTGTVRGDVILGVDGVLEARIVGIGPGGRVRGSGTVIADQGVVLIGGTIAPGVSQLGGARTAAPDATADQHSVGTLTIQGDLTISNTGVILVHVLGGTADLQDRVAVSGTATLGGQLVVNFANGYAPKTGDTLTFITATTLTGAPEQVVITGLADGFEYDISAQGGNMQLKALNDGIATTTPAAGDLYLPTLLR